MKPTLLWLPLIAVFSVGCLNAAIVTLDFEGLADGTPVAATYFGMGASFTNATAISAGISLNEVEFPPFSGTSVAFDDGAPITINFSSPVGAFSAYFTYLTRVQLIAYDAANAQVASAVSAFFENFVSSGNAPNELLQVIFGAGIDHVVITGDPLGGSFVMDDATFDTTVGGGGGVPEPGAIGLVGLGLLATLWRRRPIHRRGGPL